MSKIIVHRCDICHTAMPKENRIWISVLFETEQTEGRPIKPRLLSQELDTCEKCLSIIVDNYPLRATGAQGMNNYRLIGEKR